MATNAVQLAVQKWINGGYDQVADNSLNRAKSREQSRLEWLTDGTGMSKSRARQGELTPNVWEKLILKWPVAFFSSVLLVSIAMIVIVVAKNEIKLGDGFVALSSVTQMRIDATGELRSLGALSTPAPSPGGRRLHSTSDCNTGKLGYSLYYEAVDRGNLLTEKNLKSICEFERKVVHGAPSYHDYTCDEHSSQGIRRLSNCSGCLFVNDSSCELVGNWSTNLEAVASMKNRTELVDATFDAQFRTSANRTSANTAIESKYLRTVQHFSSDANPYLRKFTKYLDERKHVFEGIKFYYKGAGYADKARTWDMLYGMASVAVVFLYLAVMKGTFIASVGMLEILLSLPLAVFVWFEVLGRTHVTAIQGLSAFIVLGIGADDIFVMTDAWTQSKEEVGTDIKSRFCWTYRRAFWAIFTTSATTFVAFMAAALTPVPAIHAFGIFAAYAVLFDFVLVMTLFASALIIRETHFPTRRARTPLLSADWLKGAADKLNKLPKVRYCIIATFGVLAAISLYLYMHELPTAPVMPSLFPVNSPETRFNVIQNSGFKADSDSVPIRFDVVWGLHDTAPLKRGNKDPLRDNTEEPSPTVVYNKDWQTNEKTIQMQKEMVQVCKNIAAYRAAGVEGGNLTKPYPQGQNCWPLLHQKWCDDLTNIDRTWPAQTGTELYNDLKKMKGTEKWLHTAGYHFEKNSDKTYTLKAAWVGFDSPLFEPKKGSEVPNAVMRLHDSGWKAFLKKQKVSGWHTCQWLKFLVLSTTMSDSAKSGIFLSLALAFGVLILATRNIVVSAIAMSSIVGSMLTCFGVMALLGWKVSIIESICMIIVVGMAVDYAVHMMHSYNTSTGTTRFEKAEHALTEMGGSVIGGAVTTLGASAPLLFADQTMYSVFGSFMFILVASSVTWSILYLIPVAMSFGPEGENYKLKFMRYWLCCQPSPPKT